MTLPMDDYDQLCPDDRRLLDALVDNDWDAKALEPLNDVDCQRVQRLMSLFGLLQDYPVGDSDDALVDATLARINLHEDRVAASMSFESAQDEALMPRGPRIRLPDFVTVAAVLLIGVGILWPVIGAIRQNSIDTACRENHRQLGQAFSAYAEDHNLMAPTASYAGFAPNLLMDTRPLLEGGYCTDGHLNCPGHDDEDNRQSSSYSYQLVRVSAGAENRVVWGASRMAVLGDRSPIRDVGLMYENLSPLVNSSNHGERGQNVLFSDGSVEWLAQPVRGDQDNIWRLDADSDQAEDVYLLH